MPFGNGSVSFRQFAVVGQAPSSPDQATIDKLVVNAFKVSEVGVQPVEYGWAGGRHLYDTEFSFENNVYGEALMFALRIDTNQVPGAVKRAYTAIEEAALSKNNPSGFLSKLQKQEAKDTVNRKCDEEQKQGKYRRSKVIPILWDMHAGIMYAQISGGAMEKLLEIFERTFGLALNPIDAASIAKDKLGEEKLEELRPSRFAIGPDGEGVLPEYPWTSKVGTDAYLGNEFLLWLMHKVENDGAVVPTLETGPYRNATILFTRSVDIDCAYGETGRDVIKGTAPTQSPEFREGIRSGKVPRKVAMTVEFAGGNQYSFTMDPETFTFGGTKLPDVEEADNPRVLLEERIKLIADVATGMKELFVAFLSDRTNKWEEVLGEIRGWVTPSEEETEEAEEEIEA